MELFIFTNRSDALLGSKIAFTQMKRTDLNMHVGVEDVKSKAKAMFFPTRENIQNWITDYNKATPLSTTMPIIDPNAPKQKNSWVKK